LRIQVNGEPHDIPDNLSLSELLDRLELPANRVAVELNKTVVRRSEWNNQRLQEEDRVEVVHFVGGGLCISR
jgi:sulfur carrier protein